MWEIERERERERDGEEEQMRTWEKWIENIGTGKKSYSYIGFPKDIFVNFILCSIIKAGIFVALSLFEKYYSKSIFEKGFNR